jgi:glycosyltransferase involved in cell wall biosynthesis
MAGDALQQRASTLLVFTQSYPYAVALEDTFLAPELPHLRDAFDDVIVIPGSLEGSRASVPAHIEVDEEFAQFLKGHSRRSELAARGNISRLLREELTEDPWLVARPIRLSRLLAAASRAELTRTWVKGLLGRRRVSPSACVAYTFWCDAVTAGLGLLKRESPGLVVVSRAHGADLYPDRHDPPYLPCRAFTLRQLDRLLPDSERGVAFVAEHYPWFASRCEVARMGVADPGFVTPRSPAGRFVVVSCSRIVPLKRVELIGEAVDHLARARPDTQFEWYHFGEGPLQPRVEKIAQRLAPNAKAHLPGYSSVEALFSFYRRNRVDVFVNASVSEGTSVAVMEAISCGIPVVATAVGGNPEIVSSENGALVGPDPAPAEIAAAMSDLLDRPDDAEARREGSRRVWRAKYDARANYAAFAKLLASLRRPAEASQRVPDRGR